MTGGGCPEGLLLDALVVVFLETNKTVCWKEYEETLRGGAASTGPPVDLSDYQRYACTQAENTQSTRRGGDMAAYYVLHLSLLLFYCYHCHVLPLSLYSCCPENEEYTIILDWGCSEGLGAF